MRSEIAELLQQAAKNSPSESVWHAVIILERCISEDVQWGWDIRDLPENLREIRLSEVEQHEVAQFLGTLIRKYPEQGSLFWVLGKVKPTIMIKVILTLIQDIGVDLNSESAYQAMIALENCLADDLDTPFMRAILDEIRQHNPMPFLQTQVKVDDTRVREIAERLRQDLIDYGL